MVSKRRVWDWLRSNGPASIDYTAQQLDVPRDAVAHCFRALRSDGYVVMNYDREMEARATDELTVQPSPFGAGAGETRSGDPPADEEPAPRYR